MLGADAERVWNGDSSADELASLRDAFDDSDGSTRMDRLMQTDIETYLPDDLLVKVDRAGMSHSMELRSPFLDHELIEFTAGVPARYKWRRGKKKWLLKETFRGKIPDAVVNRSKQGFSVPVNAWFRDELADTARKKLNNLGTRDQFDSNGIREILEGHINQCNNNGFYLWDLIVLEIWFEQFIDPIL
jgi:asparagine synthase (glutamine-hydrolysing)